MTRSPAGPQSADPQSADPHPPGLRQDSAAATADGRRNAPATVAPLLPRDHAVHPPAFAPGYKSTALRSPRRPLVSMDPTLSELTGPAFGDDSVGPLDHDLTRNGARDGESAIGERIIVHGQVLDEAARPVPGVLMEVWQANAGGRYRHARDGYLAPLDPNFAGCGRVLSGPDGRYAFRTIRPGPYPWPNGPNDWRPAHIHFSLFGPSFAQRLITQMYFEGDPLIALCPIVNTLPTATGIAQLTAALDMDNSVPFDALAYQFDLVLRGRRATPFETRPDGG